MECALYASFLSDYQENEIEKQIHHLIGVAKQGNIQELTYASKRLKIISKEKVSDFSKMVLDFTKRTYSQQSCYNNKTIRNLHNMIDEISLQ